MEQQIKAGTAPAAQAQVVEQYKREMLAQARRTQLPAPAPKPVHTAAPAPVKEQVSPAAHVERVLERAEPIVEAVEPFAELALRSGLASAGAAAAAKGIELGMEALEHRIERKRAEEQPPAAPAPIDINITQQVVQNAPAVAAPTVAPTVTAAPVVVTPTVTAAPAVAPTVTAAPTVAPTVTAAPAPVVAQTAAPAVAAPAVAAAPVAVAPAVVTAPAVAVVTVPPPPALPPPLPALPPVIPLPPPPVPRPPVPVPVPARPPAAVLPPVKPAPTVCGTVTITVCPRCGARRSSRPAPNCRARCRCGSSQRPVPAPVPRPAPCCKTARAVPRTNAWFAQPAVEAAYAAYAAALPGDDAVPAFRMPDTLRVSAAPADAASVLGVTANAFADAVSVIDDPVLGDVAYAGSQVTAQDGWLALPAQGYASLEDYLARNAGRGILELQVRIASDDGAPVPGATVDIYKEIAGVTYLFFRGVTDAEGSVGRVALPAPESGLSAAPGFIPYAVYTVAVSHGDYAPQVFENVAIFPDTEAVQVVRLGMAETPQVIDEGLYAM